MPQKDSINFLISMILQMQMFFWLFGLCWSFCFACYFMVSKVVGLGWILGLAIINFLFLFINFEKHYKQNKLILISTNLIILIANILYVVLNKPIVSIWALKIYFSCLFFIFLLDVILLASLILISAQDISKYQLGCEE